MSIILWTHFTVTEQIHTAIQKKFIFYNTEYVTKQIFNLMNLKKKIIIIVLKKYNLIFKKQREVDRRKKVRSPRIKAFW